ncbi:MAG: DUF3185 family protein, partial [Pseudomonadota bacterium]
EPSMSKSSSKMAGIALLVIGTGLAFWGYEKSGGFESRVSNLISGSPSDNVMMWYIAGAACFAAGLFLVLKK